VTDVILPSTIRFARTSLLLLAACVFAAPSERSLAQSTAAVVQAVPERSAISRIDGDTWLTTNASFDGTSWSSADPSRASFALWMNDNGYMPNEGKTGAAGFWTHRADCPRAFERITASCGWNLGLTVTQWKSVVVGGNAVEIDGNNAAPFGRVVNTTDGERRFIGLESNVFGDFSGFDIASRPSWIAGIDITGDEFAIKRLRANPGARRVHSNDFVSLVDIDHDGNTSIAGKLRAARLAQPKPGQFATRATLSGGRAVFAFPRAYAVTPVCVANGEGQESSPLRVAPSKSACVVTSANGKDNSVVDIVVIGNPD
jgi:hypothetical protein